MSSPVSPQASCGLSFLIPQTIKDLFSKAPKPYVLIPILKVVVQASAAFTPLQSAAGGLLSIMEIVEVRFRSSP